MLDLHVSISCMGVTVNGILFQILIVRYRMHLTFVYLTLCPRTLLYSRISSRRVLFVFQFFGNFYIDNHALILIFLSVLKISFNWYI